MKRVLFFFLGIVCFASCTKRVYLKKIDSYLNASSVAVKSKYMSEDYQSFFMEKKGAGEGKEAALQSFQNWDGPLNPDVKILAYAGKDGYWVIKFKEQNDFSKLIGFPGWKGSMIIRFNANDLIGETIYVPDPANPSYKPWLQPALDWLEKNFPEELKTVYENKKLVKNEISAHKWKFLLKKWKDQEKNPH